MKIMKMIGSTKIMMIVAVMLFVFSSCSEEEPVPVPVADFSFAVDSENTLMVAFTNSSLDAETYSWDFGDGSDASTETNPTHTYAEGGTYTVTLTATSKGGTDDATAVVTLDVFGIQGGDMSDPDAWTVINLHTSNSGIVTLEDGVVAWSATADNSWDNTAHMAIYQAVNLQPGTYSADMDIVLNGVSDIWFDAFIGPNGPTAGSDYTPENSGATKLLSHNAWDCPDNNTYSGSLADVSCNTDNSFTVETAGTYYFLIKSGGINFGEGGLVVDNVVLEEM